MGDVHKAHSRRLLFIAATLFSAAWHGTLCFSASGQEPTSVRVRVRDGLEFSIPASLRAITAPPQNSGSGVLEQAYVDASWPPLQVLVFRSEKLRRKSLPPASDAVADEFTAGLVDGARKTSIAAQVFDVSRGTYNPQQGSFVVTFKTRTAASRVRQLLDEPDSSLNWQEIQRTGADIGQLRCVFGQLLGNAAAVDKAQLSANYETAARACGWSVERVSQYVATVGTGIFGVDESVTAAIAFFMRSALVQVAVSAPSSRAQDVQAAAQLILSSAKIHAEAKPQITILYDLENMSALTAGRLVGTVLGPFLIVIFVGGLLAWALTRFGVGPAPSCMAACTLLMVLGAIMALSAPEFSIFTIVQLTSYIAASLLAFRPMSKWLERKTQQRAV